MKMIVLAVAAVAPLLAQAAKADTLVQSSTEVHGYAKTTPEGGLRGEQAWEGYKIFKRENGSCYRIVRTNFRIEDAPDGQRAVFKEEIAEGPCPHALVVFPQASGTQEPQR